MLVYSRTEESHCGWNVVTLGRGLHRRWTQRVNRGQKKLDFVSKVGSQSSSLATQGIHVSKISLYTWGKQTVGGLEEKLGDSKKLIIAVQIGGDYGLDQGSMRSVKEIMISRMWAKERT